MKGQDWHLSRRKACFNYSWATGCIPQTCPYPGGRRHKWQVKVVQSRQQSRQQAEGTEVHRGLVIRWDCGSVLSITEEVGKENEVGGPFSTKPIPTLL